MNLQVTILFLVVSSFTIAKSQDTAFILYNANGEKINFEEMVNRAIASDIVLFGEFHDQPICHWLQKELLLAMIHQSGKEIIVGLEMIETDNQIHIDEYFSGIITEKKFEEEVRLWKNYKTDYKPIVDIAKNNELKVVGTNVPGRYANAVYNQGVEVLDKLSNDGKKFISPLPLTVDFELPGYSRLLEMAGDHAGENFVYAQALRDATMAYSILKYFKPDALFLHLNGSYHSDNYEAIGYYIRQSNPEYNQMTISTVYQKNIDSLDQEYLNKADVIICIPENMNRSY